MTLQKLYLINSLEVIWLRKGPVPFNLGFVLLRPVSKAFPEHDSLGLLGKTTLKWGFLKHW